jgi:hypothetical protein
MSDAGDVPSVEVRRHAGRSKRRRQPLRKDPTMVYTDGRIDAKTFSLIDFPKWVKKPSKCKIHTHKVVTIGEVAHGAEIVHEVYLNKNTTHSACEYDRKTHVGTIYIR